MHIFTILYAIIIVMDKSKDLHEALYYQTENNIYHARYEDEVNFYAAVKNGDLEKVKKLYTPLNTKEGLGHLSNNPISNLRYHLIVAVGLITRYCAEAGMPFETAYTLSDLYIQNADKCSSEEGIIQLQRDMIFDFTKRMKNIRIAETNPQIKLAKKYIHENIYNQFHEEEVADFAGLTPSYLSTLFKKETGETIKNYILKEKIEESKNLLRFSDKSYIDISISLNFSSHSHFIATFKKYVNMTPKEYRNKFYGKQWDMDSEEGSE